MKTPVFVGIDVACARRKRLPICVAAFNQYRLEPLKLPLEIARDVPLGLGNGEILSANPFRTSATTLAGALARGESEYGWNITRVAVDAPAAPPAIGERLAEKALRSCGLSSFQTPDDARWLEIRESCRSHLEDKRALSRIPHANKIWMLYGFEIFKVLRANGTYEIIEVYPYAIVRALLAECPHKTTLEGYRCQLEAISTATGWTPIDLEHALKCSVPGSKHDRLDAFMAAWVASLPNQERRAYGKEKDPNDAIWVPRNR